MKTGSKLEKLQKFNKFLDLINKDSNKLDYRQIKNKWDLKLSNQNQNNYFPNNKTEVVVEPPKIKVSSKRRVFNKYNLSQQKDKYPDRFLDRFSQKYNFSYKTENVK